MAHRGKGTKGKRKKSERGVKNTTATYIDPIQQKKPPHLPVIAIEECLRAGLLSRSNFVGYNGSEGDEIGCDGSREFEFCLLLTVASPRYGSIPHLSKSATGMVERVCDAMG